MVGKVQVTVVPWPTAESIVTEPPCSSTKERTSDRPRPGPRCCEPRGSVSNQSNTLSCLSAGMPGPRSVTAKVTASGVRSAVSVMVSPGGEKPTALASRLNRICRSRRSSAVKLPMLGAAGLGIAFRAKPIVAQSARHHISQLGLDGILYLLGVRDRELIATAAAIAQ